MQFFSRQRSSAVEQYWGSRVYTRPERSARRAVAVFFLPQEAQENSKQRASASAAPRRSILFFGVWFLMGGSFSLVGDGGGLRAPAAGANLQSPFGGEKSPQGDGLYGCRRGVTFL